MGAPLVLYTNAHISRNGIKEPHTEAPQELGVSSRSNANWTM